MNDDECDVPLSYDAAKSRADHVARMLGYGSFEELDRVMAEEEDCLTHWMATNLS